MKRAWWLALSSLALGALGVYLVGQDAFVTAASYRPVHRGLGPYALSLACLVGMWYLPSVRVRWLAAHHGFRIGRWSSWLAHVSMVFGSAVTPSGTGGAPALVAALVRLGVPWGTGMGIAVQILILDLIAFVCLVPTALGYVLLSRHLELPAPLFALSIAATVVAAGGAVWLMRYPRIAARLMLALARLRWMRRWQARLRSQARHYYRSVVAFAQLTPSGWIGLVLASMSGWLASFTLFWSLLIIYGGHQHLLDVLAVLSAVTIASFFVPTPGAAGFIEVAAGIGVDARASASATAALTLWRVASFYACFGLGPLASWCLLRHSNVARGAPNGSSSAG